MKPGKPAVVRVLHYVWDHTLAPTSAMPKPIWQVEQHPTWVAEIPHFVVEMGSTPRTEVEVRDIRQDYASVAKWSGPPPPVIFVAVQSNCQSTTAQPAVAWVSELLFGS